MTYGALNAVRETYGFAAQDPDFHKKFTSVGLFYEHISNSAGLVFRKEQFDNFVMKAKKDPAISEEHDIPNLADIISQLIRELGSGLRVVQRNFKIPRGYGDIYENYSLSEIFSTVEEFEEVSGRLQEQLN